MNIIEMDKQATYDLKDEFGNWIGTGFDKEKFAELVAAHEREACAKLLETTDLGGLKDSPTTQSWIAAMLLAYADAIRARGKA